MEKQALRKTMKAIRSATDADERAGWSKAIASALCASEFWIRAETIGLYASFRGEVDTWSIMERVHAAGKTLALPKVTDPKGPLSFYGVAAGPDWPLATGAFGVREPDDTCPEISHDAIDLLLVPALAISETGARLGWGGGYYDRTLAKMPSAKALALVFQCQIIPSVPTGPHDRAVHGWVTERGVQLV